MTAAVNYAGDKSRIRAELMTLAQAGELTYYGVLGASVAKPARWPLWKAVLDEISLETPKTDPDITFLVTAAALACGLDESRVSAAGVKPL